MTQYADSCQFPSLRTSIGAGYAYLNCSFVEAAYGERLNITREMLTLVLSYHQVLPSFLEFLFPFARDLYHADFHFGGLRYQARFAEADKGLCIPERGWSGRDVRLCYNLKSAEHDWDENAKEWPWYMGQSAVHHSFDLETGQASWFVVKGDSRLKRRIKSATQDPASLGLSFLSLKKAFTSTLTIHLIFCEWSGQNWRRYVNFLDKKIQSSTKRAVSSLLETPMMTGQEQTARIVRQRRGRGTGQVPEQASASGTSHTSFLGGQSQTRSTRDQGTERSIPMTTINSQGNHSKRAPEFSFSDLQGTHHVEEIVNDAKLLVKVNQNVLTDIKEVYKSFEGSPAWPVELSSHCRGELDRFQQRIRSIKNDMAIQQSRIENLLTRIADRKSLVCTYLFCRQGVDQSSAPGYLGSAKRPDGQAAS